MKILFIMPLALPAYLFQLAALAAFLKSKGHTVRYEELVINGKLEQSHFLRIKQAIEEFRPNLVGFSSYEMSFPWISQICEYIKSSNPSLPIIVGGYYATLSPEEVLRCPWVDIACVGEGEYPLEELLDSLKSGSNRTDIQNLYFNKSGGMIANSLRPLIANLDELPFVDRGLFTSEKRKSGTLEVMASRGCPFDCTNCANHALKKIYAGCGPYLRYRSINHVITEIQECLKKETVKEIHFEDDMFTSNPKWLREFCAVYKSQINLPFVCNIRPESGTIETLTLLKNSGCTQISVGVEAGDKRIRKLVLARNMDDAVIIQAFNNARKLKIKTKSFNMVGLPEETLGSLWKTIFLNLRLRPDSVQTSVYYPFKGTVLGDRCYHNGWVDFKRKKKLKLYANDSVLNLPTVSRQAIKIAKWLNSATALASGNFNLIKIAFSQIFKQCKIRLFPR